MYSNCLFEALRAKLKNPRHVKIIRLSKEVNNEGRAHYMWMQGDYVYHAFHKNGDDENNFWYEYNVKKIPRIVFQRWLFDRLAGKAVFQKYAEKFDLPLRNLKAVKDWATYFIDFVDGTVLEDLAYDSYEEVKRFLKKEPQIKVVLNGELKMLTFEELKQVKETCFYKFITPYDADFGTAYGSLERRNALEMCGD